MAEQLCGAPGCGCPSPLARLCVTHLLELRQDLDDLIERPVRDSGRPLPTLLDELDTTLSRQARLGGGPGWRRPGGETPLPWNDAASRARRRLDAALRHWAAAGLPFQPPRPADTLLAARQVAARLDDIALLPDAGQALADITGAVAEARRIIDRPPERWYGGRCGLDGCPGEVRGAVGAATAVCDTCRARYDMASRRRWLLEHAQDYLLTAQEASRALPALLDDRDCLSVDTIRTWARTGLHPATGRVLPLTALRAAYPHAQPRLPSYRAADTTAPVHRVRDIITLALRTPTRRRERHAA